MDEKVLIRSQLYRVTAKTTIILFAVMFICVFLGFRAGFGVTRKQSRQIVNHGHILVNGKKVDIPSYLLKAGDVVTIRERSQSFVKSVIEMIDLPCESAWITKDKDAMKITFDRVPEREELDPELKEQLVIEYYSK